MYLCTSEHTDGKTYLHCHSCMGNVEAVRSPYPPFFDVESQGMTTSTLTVTEFVGARLAEDEAAADRAASAEHEWSIPFDYIDHAARHDPARVLAQCAAMRKIVEDLTAERHEVVEDCWYTCAGATEEHDGGECCDENRRGTGCDCGRDTRVNRRLGILASIWSDHSDFREEWR
jgi:hypothetical protein